MWVALLCGSVVVRFLAAVTGGGDRLMIIIGLHLPLCYPDGVSLWLAASFFFWLLAGCMTKLPAIASKSSTVTQARRWTT